MYSPYLTTSHPLRFELTINTTLWNTIQLLFPSARSAPITPPAASANTAGGTAAGSTAAGYPQQQYGPHVVSGLMRRRPAVSSGLSRRCVVVGWLVDGWVGGLEGGRGVKARAVPNQPRTPAPPTPCALHPSAPGAWPNVASVTPAPAPFPPASAAPSSHALLPTFTHPLQAWLHPPPSHQLPPLPSRASTNT